MKVLVLNVGSSSIKYKLIDYIDAHTETVMCSGEVDRIGNGITAVAHKVPGGEKYFAEIGEADHAQGLAALLDLLVDDKYGVINDLSEIEAIGHRVVHGGSVFNKARLVDEQAIRDVESFAEMAPLHNPAAALVLRTCVELMPNTPMVIVADTAFHQTIPPKAHMYAVPLDLYEKYGVRKYGFHGTSHQYVAEVTAEMLGKDVSEIKVISCHLGNGASVCAIDNGKSVDTSMGFTPSQGLIMGTRAGDIDPNVIPYIASKTGQTFEEVLRDTNKKYGILALTGFSADFRDIREAAFERHDEVSIRARSVYAHRIKQYVGAYYAVLNGADAVVFTGGIAEHDPRLRAEALSDLENLGIIMDDEVNLATEEFTGFISKPESPVKVLLITANEEHAIAGQVVATIKENR